MNLIKSGKLKIYNLIYFILIFAITSCSHPNEKLTEKEFKQKYESKLISVNKFLLKKDEEAIRSYIKRRQWDMKTSGSGLYYEIYRKSDGKKSEIGKLATINFKIWLLDGTLCYSSDSLGSRTFTISQGGVESGLEEGILLMKEGEQAHFIMPPYMAHGLIGDDNKIPPRSTIVYEVELVKISN